jgi:hypothetical protein
LVGVSVKDDVTYADDGEDASVNVDVIKERVSVLYISDDDNEVEDLGNSNVEAESRTEDITDDISEDE